MTPVFHTVLIMPNQSIGAFVAHFTFHFGVQELSVYEFLAPLSDLITGAHEYLATGIPLRNAQAIFLQNVILTSSH